MKFARQEMRERIHGAGPGRRQVSAVVIAVAAQQIVSNMVNDSVYAAAGLEINSAHFTDVPHDEWDEPRFPAALVDSAAGLRVAVVGTGPAASYTAAALLTTSAHVTLLDRLPVPGGLVRFGVAPDHPSTKAVAGRFAALYRNPRLQLLLDVEVGTHLSHADLLAHHDAVVYAVGAAADRLLGVPGESLPGCVAARTFVGWYNAQPEVPADAVDLGAGPTGRAVVVGTGNVALDMARILLTEPADLGRTDIADHALHALRRSTVTEVVVVGRRGPGAAAYSLPELRDLLLREDLDVVVDGGPKVAAEIAAAAPGSLAAALQGVPVRRLDHTGPAAPGRRLVLRFGSTVHEVQGTDRVEAVWLRPTDDTSGSPGSSTVATGLLLRSVGYRSEPVADLPFDHTTHTVPHRAGRVVDPATGEPVPAAYVVGWIKRGPRGGIGANRADAAETVATLVEDANAGRITTGVGSPRSVRRLVRRHRPEALDRRDFEAIDARERADGESQGRPRVKLATLDALVAARRHPRRTTRPTD